MWRLSSVAKTYASDGQHTHLATGVMAQIVPVDFEHALVVHMHQLVYDSVFHVGFAPESTLAEYRDPGAGDEPARAIVAARLAAQMLRSDGTSGLFEPFQHKNYCWA